MEENICNKSTKKSEEIRKIKNYNNTEKIIYQKRNTKLKKRKNGFWILNNIYKNYFYICIFFFISNYFQISLLKTLKIRKLDTTSDITITIRGTGTQKILSDSYTGSLPIDVLINNNPTSIGKTVSGLTQGVNNITMRWGSGKL